MKAPNGSGLLTGVALVRAGYRYSLAVKTDGTVWTWGINTYDQLGDGTRATRALPVPVLTSTSGGSALTHQQVRR